ncbi:MAG: alanine--tRNA ligase [Thalassobaculaceae bacterium]
METTNEIRKVFLDFFKRDQHEVIESSSLVPRNDPTLLFTNAGMVQFKNVFTGIETREYNRAVTSQKCVRAGGKHNDLENVGYTARHHTFFEMLGNFSFGDYFKDVAIENAWNLITKDYGLPKEKLLVTVYSEDEEAASLWRRIAGLDNSKIIRISTADNFWAMGDTGPCGPCSEIFFDHGDQIPGGPPGSPDEDGDRFIEIWNLVFMQYEQIANDKRIDLPRPSIDTGMGLERISAILQGKHDNYDIDLMRSLIEASASVSNVDPDGPDFVSHRVIADHLRASSFLIADGVLPSNEGRGYVLRRIMRRAMRHAHLLGCKEPLIWKLVPALIRQMGEAFSELVRAESLIVETLKLEETKFKETLGRGLRQLEDAAGRLSEGAKLPGEVAFKLYDTYGFPLDLTQDIMRGQGRAVELAEFQKAMDAQKAAARASWSGSGDASTDELWFDIRQNVGPTEFLGYSTGNAEGQVLGLVVNDEQISSVEAGEKPVSVIVLLNQTPFYGESGGQVGDRGKIVSANGTVIDVTDVKKKVDDLFLHIGEMKSGKLDVGDFVELQVDKERRDRLSANHSATHLMHEALRMHLGDHVAQKGSSVAEKRLRFDFSHSKGVSRGTLSSVELDVNNQIRDNSAVVTRVMDSKSAIEEGAMALFGEKYGDEVRVVTMGKPIDDNVKKNYSVELCGGTHVERTGDIGIFKIIAESAVASGVRRIEAVTGDGALEYFGMQEKLLEEASNVLKVTAEQLPGRVANLIEEKRKLEKELGDLRRKLATAGTSSKNDKNFVTAGDTSFVGRVLEGVPARELKGLVDEIKNEIGSGVVAVISAEAKKVSLVVGITKDLEGKYNAIDLVRLGVTALGGKGGGGRWDMAQAGGSDYENGELALKKIKKAISQ